ncbi:MAG: hypothetical protein ACT4O0_09060 [Pseudonocardia sp.]
MPWTGRRAGAGLLVRLLRVGVVVAAFGVLLVPLCVDGMHSGNITMASAHTAVVGTATHERPAAGTAQCLGHCAPGLGTGPGLGAGPGAGPGLGAPPPLVGSTDGPLLPAESEGGLLAACIVFLVAVLVVASGTRRLGRAGRQTVDPPARPAIRRYPRRRRLVVELCVIRA